MNQFQLDYLELIKNSVLDLLNTRCDKGVVDTQNKEDAFSDRVFQHVWHGRALSMCTITRLDSMFQFIFNTINNKVDGDIIECGVWRGGCAIYMQAILYILGRLDKKLFLADSYCGLPIPDTELDKEMYYNSNVEDVNRLFISEETVRDNFTRYNLLFDNVIFLKGWFKDTLPTDKIKSLSILRIDCDFYESTLTTLEQLYPKLSIGGYVVLDDYRLDICDEKKATDYYRKIHNIKEKIVHIDWQSSYWIKENEID
ncbi:MAG: TylF/MycF family methyltransferase [Gammaproteobacteria bacterium]|nr:TylF/MycF family methyltransferase [Gammaproteobacteria bacterium]